MVVVGADQPQTNIYNYKYQGIYKDMKHYLTTDDKFIDLKWFEAENKTMIVKSLDFKTIKAFYLDCGDYLNQDEFEEDKEFIKGIVNQLLNGKYELYWIE